MAYALLTYVLVVIHEERDQPVHLGVAHPQEENPAQESAIKESLRRPPTSIFFIPYWEDGVVVGARPVEPRHVDLGPAEAEHGALGHVGGKSAVIVDSRRQLPTPVPIIIRLTLCTAPCTLATCTRGTCSSRRPCGSSPGTWACNCCLDLHARRQNYEPSICRALAPLYTYVSTMYIPMHAGWSLKMTSPGLMSLSATMNRPTPSERAMR